MKSIGLIEDHSSQIKWSISLSSGSDEMRGHQKINISRHITSSLAFVCFCPDWNSTLKISQIIHWILWQEWSTKHGFGVDFTAARVCCWSVAQNVSHPLARDHNWHFNLGETVNSDKTFNQLDGWRGWRWGRFAGFCVDGHDAHLMHSVRCLEGYADQRQQQTERHSAVEISWTVKR